MGGGGVSAAPTPLGPPKQLRKPRAKRPPALPPPPASEPVASPGDQLDETVEGHAVVLARAQATMGEIVASVAEAFALPLAEAAKQVEVLKVTLLVAAHSGRAFLRRRIFDAATGRVIISRDERNLLMTLGRQHLGHTAAGTDAKVRKVVESAERRALAIGAGSMIEGADAPPAEQGDQI